MGGAPEGDVAAKLVLDTVRGTLEDPNETRNVARTEAPQQAIRVLESGLRRAHNDLRALGREDPGRRGMGTTFTGMWVIGQNAILAHVGDSRAYRWRHGRLTQLTQDHSIVQEFVRVGLLDAADIKDHPYRHMLSRVIGGRQTHARDLTIDTCIDVPECGDIYLMTTDGVHDVLDDETLAGLLLVEPDPARVVSGLLERALAAGGPDNCTAVVVRFDDLGCDAKEGAC
jgi:protein phosphatase